MRFSLKIGIEFWNFELNFGIENWLGNEVVQDFGQGVLSAFMLVKKKLQKKTMESIMKVK